MAEVIVATLNVSFDADANGDSQNSVLKLEIDDREDGLNGGDTRFSPGENAYYFMFKDSNVSLVAHQSTAGGITSSGIGDKTIDENISFSNSDTASLSYPPNGTVAMQWLGRCYQITGTTVSPNSALPNQDRSDLKMAGGKKVAGILNCKYTATGSLFLLGGVPSDFKEVMVIAIGTA